MENNNLFSGEKRKGFTIVEMAVVILILGIMASVMTFSPEIAKQTAKREAERLHAYLYKVIGEADRRHMNFDLEIGPIIETGKCEVAITWPKRVIHKSFDVKPGFLYSNNFTDGKGTYNARNKRFNSGATITVKDPDGQEYYIIIASTEGRIYLSPTR